MIKYIENNFKLVITLITLSLFTFNLWLFFPGYIHHDWGYILGGLRLNNWQPVIYPWLLRKLSNLFGYHIYYPLLFNLIPFYLGLYIIVLGLWEKFRSKWCLIGYFPICIGNIFFSNIVAHGSYSSPMLIFLLWSIVLYQLLVGITLKNSIILFISFFFAVISRHNAMIQVYPIFFIYSWIIVQQLKLSSVWRNISAYIGLLFLFAVLTLTMALGIPNLLKEYPSYPTTHIFLHQIAGACVPNNDESCFKPEWYEKERTFADAKRAYLKYPLDADRMTLHIMPDHPFKKGYLENLSDQWFKSIIRYPRDWISYVNRFRKAMWHVKPHEQVLENEIYLNEASRCMTPRCIEVIGKNYTDDELYYQTPQEKVKIWAFMKKIFPEMPIFFFISLNYILFVVAGILFAKKRNLILLYSLSSSIAGIAASIVFCIFSPYVFMRYIYPVLISPLISLIGIIIWTCNKETLKYIKEFMKRYNKIINAAILIMLLCGGIYNYQYGPLTARIDVYTPPLPYSDEPVFFVTQQNNSQSKVENARTLEKSKQGVVMQNFGNGMTFTIVALQNADITIELRGPDKYDSNGKRHKKWVKYTTFKVNGKSVMPNKKKVWYNKPYKYTLSVQKDNIYNIILKWRKR